MAKVISKDKIDQHNVGKYDFKSIMPMQKSDSKEQKEERHTYTQENNPRARATDIDSSALSTSSKDSLIESLMQKTDEMSSNFIKLQMKLESKEEEYTQALQKAKEESFAEGVEAGSAKALSEMNGATANSVNLFATSVAKLEESSKEFESALEGIKKELMFAALDISKEVIQVELSKNSNEVAKVLAEELLKDLQSASEITLKVNPNNHGAISQNIGKLEHISIVSDSAVSEGGVIVVSDAGNIDSQISKRLERVKRAALSE
ncbi:MAG: flagellar assembly protein FliH [Campylobacterota bacterium]|nr:flagellar assembly protein FliH [Campylobacterota bacterium]